MKKSNLKTRILLLITICTFLSCEENNDIAIDQEIGAINSNIIGNWILDSEEWYGEDGTIIFTKVSDLPAEDYGISFERNNDFIERLWHWSLLDSSTFCGISPTDLEGVWELDNALLKINRDNNPQKTYTWNIISLTQEKLIVKAEI